MSDSTYKSIQATLCSGMRVLTSSLLVKMLKVKSCDHRPPRVPSILFARPRCDGCRNGVHILDWWESRRVEVDVPAAGAGSTLVRTSFDVTCTPAQHMTGRGIFDRFLSSFSSLPTITYRLFVCRLVILDVAIVLPTVKTVYCILQPPASCPEQESATSYIF